MINKIFTILTALLIGFGFWYLIFWFLTTEPNLFLWHMVTKIVYLFISIAAAQSIINNILTDNK